MKNLNLLYEETCIVEPNCRLFTVDNEASKFYCAGNHIVKGFSAETHQLSYNLDISAQSFSVNSDCNIKIVGIEYLCGEEQLCIALQNGDILLSGTTDKQVEVVGTLECEILCMSWSPDQEIVLFVTDAGSAVAMNHDFDPIAELEILTGSFGEGDFVNVGWGSKETQFQGSAGKLVPGREKKPESAQNLYDDKETKIAWRGDGQYFAISSIENSQRKFRVWNRSCQLQYTSEALSGIESCFCWKPSGSLIATSQRKVHRHDIVFFELNGLQHGEFTLPFAQNQAQIHKLEWNCDSTILALSATDISTNQVFLQLWTVSNYHWSLKQSLELSHEVTYFCWDSEKPFDLHVIAENGLYTLYHWSWYVSSSKSTCVNEHEHQSLNSSLVCVVDGKTLRVTPFKQLIIPPPMCAFQMQFKESINSTCFLEDATQPNNLGILLNNGTFLTFACGKAEVESNDVKIELMAAGGNGYSSQVTPLSIDGIFKPRKSAAVTFNWWLKLRHLVWHSNGNVSAISNHEGAEFLLSLSLDRSSFEWTCVNSFALSDFAVSLCATGQPGCILVQLKNGSVLEYSNNELKSYICYIGTTVSFSLPCPEMQLCKFACEEAANNVYGLISLSHQNRLYLDNTVLSSECTSFYLHEEYIIYTTSSHKLCFIPKLKSFLIEKQQKASGLNMKEGNEISRSVERGARIVTVTPYDTKVILQLPRGNLEVIHPRPLVISLVKYDLDHGLYKSAFLHMRKHRINMNLIHDHNSQMFLQNVNRFIKELDSVEHLNLFLSELNESDVTQTMYNQFYSAPVTTTKSLLTSTESKVEKICIAVLSELESFDIVKYFLSVLTAYVRKPTPEIEEALQRLKTMKEKQLLDETLINNSLRHLHVMVDGRILFQEALATYDLELALTVAQVSNNDPKEYIPFLNKLKGLEENYKRYRIDMHLKKYSRALVNIAKCPESFSECIELIKLQNLHREALMLFKRYTPEYREICNLYAEVLTAEHKYEEAGIILARCDNHKRAIKCFTAGGCWQLALNSASALQYTAESYFELANSLAENLASKNKHLDAAIILEEVKNLQGAIEVLLKGKLWSYALRLVRLHKLQDMIGTDVVPSLTQACTDMKTNLESYREQFNKHFTRLQVVREIKREKALLVILNQF